jgi:hypothetical protein
MSNGKPFQLLLNQALQIQLAGRSDFLCGVITNFLTEQLVVRFPQHGQMPEGLVTGQTVAIRFADASGLRVGNSEIVELCMPPRPGVILKYPLSFETIQKRRFFRVQVDFPCTVQLLQPNGMPMPNGKDTGAHILDISAGGARMSTTCPLQVGNRLQLDFVPVTETNKPPEPAVRLPIGASAAARPAPIRTPVRGVAIGHPAGPPPATTPGMKLFAKVVRMIPPLFETSNLLQAGVEFEKPSSRTEDQLVTLIFNIQRSQCNKC